MLQGRKNADKAVFCGSRSDLIGDNVVVLPADTSLGEGRVRIKSPRRAGRGIVLVAHYELVDRGPQELPWRVLPLSAADHRPPRPPARRTARPARTPWPGLHRDRPRARALRPGCRRVPG